MQYYIFILFVLLVFSANAQEHILNGSFEDYGVCPAQQGSLPKYWNSILSPDYYNACANTSNNDFGIPNNWEGVQYPKNGKAYMGIWGLKNDVGEFIQAKLNFELIKGQKYYVEFYTSKADKRKGITSSLGIFLTVKSESTKRTDGGIKFANKYEPYITNPDTCMLSNSDIWYKISASFTAKGGEQYLLIGNSKEPGMAIIDEGINKKKRNKNMYDDPDFYYYIDCVSLWPIDSLGNKIDIHTKVELVSLDSVKAGEAVVLNNIYFETAKANLLLESSTELDKLFLLMKASPTIKLEIAGHTDNSGNEESNKNLSEERAKSVVQYLITKGISSERLSYKGYGSSNPIESNDTEIGKSKNRRVEFIVQNK